MLEIILIIVVFLLVGMNVFIYLKILKKPKESQEDDKSMQILIQQMNESSRNIFRYNKKQI